MGWNNAIKWAENNLDILNYGHETAMEMREDGVRWDELLDGA